MDQDLAGQILRPAQAALDQCRRADRQAPDLDQRLEFEAGRMLAAIADGDIDGASMPVRRVDMQRQAGHENDAGKAGDQAAPRVRPT